VRVSKSESGSVLRIEGTLDISVAFELRDALRELLSGTSRPAVDLSDIGSCDTTALQLLFAARKTAHLSAKDLRLTGLSAAVAETCTALGVPIDDLVGGAGAAEDSVDSIGGASHAL
jgi:anti-anti-sigma factor